MNCRGCILIPLAACAAAPAAELGLQVQPALWLAEGGGDVALVGLLAPLPGLSLTRVEMAVHSQAVTPQVSVCWRIPGSDFDLAVGGFRYAVTASEDAVGRQALWPLEPDLATAVEVDYDLLDLSAELRWRAVDTPQFGLGLGLAVHGLWASVEPDGIAIDLTVDESIAFPLVGLECHYQPWDWLRLEARAAGMAIDYGDDGIEFVDLAAGVELQPWTWLGVYGGYRYTAADAVFGSVSRGLINGRATFDIALRGPVFGVTLNF